MKFVDEASIYARAGRGGNGAATFKRFKTRIVGPDGGDGGHGGSVFLEAKENTSTLLELRFTPRYVAKNGQPGASTRKTGQSGGDIIVPVPVGTLVRDAETQTLLGDLSSVGQRLCIARGGRGGRGNVTLANLGKPSDVIEEGQEGEERTLDLELKLIADVGLLGFPNAGKSTLISRISAARPKIADYPFTTLVPNLGVVRVDNERSFVVADIPGLIEGASDGAGLGLKFLRHIERTRLFLHLISLSGLEARGPQERFEVINRELARYDEQLLNKPQVVLLTQIDTLEDRENLLPALLKSFETSGRRVYAISAVTGEGLRELIFDVARILEESRSQPA